MTEAEQAELWSRNNKPDSKHILIELKTAIREKKRCEPAQQCLYPSDTLLQYL